LNWSFTSGFADYITVRGAQVGNKSYTIQLQWQTRTQTFEIVDIAAE
jgi:hypothetical protein